MNTGSLRKKKILTNPFHEIRKREFRRKDECERGATLADVQPAYFTPSLQEICAAVIADTFDEQPNVESLEPELYRLVIGQLGTDLRLERAVQRVKSESYWRACAMDKWSLGKLTDLTPAKKLQPPEKGGWKRLYLERTLEEHLMSIDPASFNGDSSEEQAENGITSLCTICGADVYSLKLTQQMYHLDVNELFTKLPHLEEFSVTYGTLNAGVNFRMDMLGMKQADALGFQKVLRSFPSLTTLRLTGNSIDADLLKCICAGLVKNTTLLTLDLSHNKITDVGIAALATVLMKKDSSVRALDLSDNRIRADGGKALGQMLTVNGSLQELSLRLNRLGDIGGHYFFDGLRRNSGVRSLNLACNELGAEAARSLSEALRSNEALRSLDISGNAFMEEGGRMLAAAVRESHNLCEIDTRQSGMAEADAQAMAEVTRQRVVQQHMVQVDNVESQMRDTIQRQVAEKIRKTHGV